jgi:hypothetical protein
VSITWTYPFEGVHQTRAVSSKQSVETDGERNVTFSLLCHHAIGDLSVEHVGEDHVTAEEQITVPAAVVYDLEHTLGLQQPFETRDEQRTGITPASVLSLHREDVEQERAIVGRDLQQTRGSLAVHTVCVDGRTHR